MDRINARALDATIALNLGEKQAKHTHKHATKVFSLGRTSEPVEIAFGQVFATLVRVRSASAACLRYNTKLVHCFALERRLTQRLN